MQMTLIISVKNGISIYTADSGYSASSLATDIHLIVLPGNCLAITNNLLITIQVHPVSLNT